MTASDALEHLLADMRRRLGDDPDAAAIREAAARTVRDGDDSEQSLEETDVDALVEAYRERFVEEANDEDEDEVPADHTESGAVDAAGAADHTAETPSSEGAGGETGHPHDSARDESRRIDRVAHFRDSVRTAGEWTEIAGRIGPGVFDIGSDAETTDGMDAQLAAQFEGVDYTVQSYTLGPDDRHPSWTQIRVSEPFDPSNLPEDVTIRKVEDVP